MWARFTERARRTVFFAQEEAAGRGENYVSTEHFLLGLTRETDHVAAKMLERLHLTLPDIRAKVEATAANSGANPAKAGKQDMQLTPRAKKVVDLAYDEARKLSNNYIGTEHLLLGLLHDDGLGGRVLRNMGAELNTARAVLQQMQSEGRENEGKKLPDPKNNSLVPFPPSIDAPRDAPQPGDLGVLKDSTKPDRSPLEVAVSSEALLSLRDAIRLKDHHEYRDLFAQGKFTLVNRETPLKMLRLDAASSGYFVRQIGGPHDGTTGWILPEHFEWSGPDTRPFPPPLLVGETTANLSLTLSALLGVVPHETGAELCLVSGLPPIIRTKNMVVPMTSEREGAAILDEAAVRALLSGILDDNQREMLQANRVMHFSYQLPNEGPRFQIHIRPQPGRISALCTFDGEAGE